MNNEGLGDDVRRYLTILLHWWWVVLLVPVLVALYVVFFTGRGETVLLHKAEARILVQQVSSSGMISSDSVFGSERLANIYAELITEPRVMTEVGEVMGLEESPEEMAGWVSAEVVEGTPIIQIEVTHEDPTLAPAIANKVAQVFIAQTEENYLERVARLQNMATSMGVSYQGQILTAQLTALGSLVLIREATEPGSPVVISSRPMNLPISVVLASFAGIALAVGLESLSDRVRSPERLERVTAMKPVAVVPKWGRREVGKHEAVMLKRPQTHYAESYRQLSASLQVLWSEADRRSKAYVITSPGPLEGKTTTAVNLAIAISETGRNVLLVDGDLYRPCIHRYFNLRNDTGLTNLLADSDVELQSLLRPTDVKTLRVITSGPRSPKPSELIKKDVPERVLEALKEEAEVVIVDAPPVLARSDAVRLVHCGDGTIILADANTTRTGSLKRTMELLETSKSDDRESLLAVVLNRFKPPRLAYYVYYRYYDEYRHYYGEREVLEHRSTGRGGTRRYKESKSWWGMFRMKKVKKIVTRRIRGVTDDTDR